MRWLGQLHQKKFLLFIPLQKRAIGWKNYLKKTREAIFLLKKL